MLGKLIKYDLKALAKILAPLWGVLLVMGLIFGISIRIRCVEMITVPSSL